MFITELPSPDAPRGGGGRSSRGRGDGGGSSQYGGGGPPAEAHRSRMAITAQPSVRSGQCRSSRPKLVRRGDTRQCGVGRRGGTRPAAAAMEGASQSGGGGPLAAGASVADGASSPAVGAKRVHRQSPGGGSAQGRAPVRPRQGGGQSPAATVTEGLLLGPWAESHRRQARRSRVALLRPMSSALPRAAARCGRPATRREGAC